MSRRNTISRYLWDYKLTLTTGIFVLILCLSPSMRSPFEHIRGADKVIHSLLFCGLSLLVYGEYIRKYWQSWHKGRLWKPLAILLLLAIVLEVAQGVLIPRRRGDLYDLGANTLGVCLGTSLIYLYLLIKRKT